MEYLDHLAAAVPRSNSVLVVEAMDREIAASAGPKGMVVVVAGDTPGTTTQMATLLDVP